MMGKEERYAAVGGSVSPATGSAGFSALVRAASASDNASRAEDLERRVMLEVARRAIARSRRRAKLALVASLSGLAMLLAACVAVLVVWFPGNVPLLGGGIPWFDDLHIPSFGILGEAARGAKESMPFLKQWGGMLVLTLFAGGAAGFIYYLNNLFSNSYLSE